MFGQALAITGINIRSIPERWTSSLVIVIGLAGVVAVFCALLAMATGFSSTLKATGREDAVIIMRGGSDAELNSGPRPRADRHHQGGARHRQRRRWQAGRLRRRCMVIAELVRKDDKGMAPISWCAALSLRRSRCAHS